MRGPIPASSGALLSDRLLPDKLLFRQATTVELLCVELLSDELLSPNGPGPDGECLVHAGSSAPAIVAYRLSVRRRVAPTSSPLLATPAVVTPDHQPQRSDDRAQATGCKLLSDLRCSGPSWPNHRPRWECSARRWKSLCLTEPVSCRQTPDET